MWGAQLRSMLPWWCGWMKPCGTVNLHTQISQTYKFLANIHNVGQWNSTSGRDTPLNAHSRTRQRTELHVSWCCHTTSCGQRRTAWGKSVVGLSIERPYMMMWLKVQKSISVILSEMSTFHLEMHKTADFHSKLLVSWELLAEGYQGRPIYKMCAFKLIEGPLPGNSLFISLFLAIEAQSTKRLTHRCSFQSFRLLFLVSHRPVTSSSWGLSVQQVPPPYRIVKCAPRTDNWTGSRQGNSHPDHLLHVHTQHESSDHGCTWNLHKSSNR